jgi:hypothetical protein
MSSRKAPILPYPNIVSGDMTANVTSVVTNIQYEDNVAISLSWIGAPTGTFAVQGSVDQVSWDPIPASPPVVAAGAPDTAIFDINQCPFPFIRVVYTFVGGAGTLNGTITAKQV